jgi:ATP/maltotriose-dependent transcriptional regulator MalT
MICAHPAASHRDVCEFLELLAFTYLQNNRPRKAAVLLMAADRLEILKDRALLMLAMAQQRSGDATQALATLDRLEALGSPNALLHALRARAWAALHQPVESQAAMREYLAARRRVAQTGGASVIPGKRKDKACRQ